MLSFEMVKATILLDTVVVRVIGKAITVDLVGAATAVVGDGV